MRAREARAWGGEWGDSPCDAGPTRQGCPHLLSLFFFFFGPNFIAFQSYILTELRYGPISEKKFRLCP